MSSAIIDGTNIDLSVFSYSNPKPNTAGGKVVNLYNKVFKDSLTISVPLMTSWGAQEGKEVIGKGPDGKPITRGTGKYAMGLQFSSGQYTTADADAFLEQMKAVETKIKQDAMAYSKDWFGKQITSMEVMDEKISPMLKYPKVPNSEERDYSRPPSLSVKLPCWKGVWQTSVFDEEYNPLYVKGKTADGVTPLDFLTCHTKMPIQVLCLIQCGGLWFVGNPTKVSITWNLTQVIVRKPKTSSIPNDQCFLSVKPSELKTLQALPESEPMHDDAVVSVLVEDSEDEGDAPVPVPIHVVSAPVEPAPVEVPVVSVPAVPVPVVEPAVVPASEPAPEPVKKKIVKKKASA